MPGAGLPCGSTQRGKAVGIFHVLTFLVTDSGGPGGKGTAARLQLVMNAHVSRTVHQELLDITMQSEYADEVLEKVCGDNGKVHGVNLQSNRGGWSRVL